MGTGPEKRIRQTYQKIHRKGVANEGPETAFFVPNLNGFHLRWFTPVAEIDLCGHATLASSHIIFKILGYTKEVIEFETRSGKLSVERKDGLLAMNFPAHPPCNIHPISVIYFAPAFHR